MKSKHGFTIVLSLSDSDQLVATVTRTYKNFKNLNMQLRNLTRYAPTLPPKFDEYGIKMGSEQLITVLENYLNEALAVTAIVKSQEFATFFGLKCTLLDAAFNVDATPIQKRDSFK